MEHREATERSRHDRGRAEHTLHDLGAEEWNHREQVEDYERRPERHVASDNDVAGEGHSERQ